MTVRRIGATSAGSMPSTGSPFFTRSALSKGRPSSFWIASVNALPPIEMSRVKSDCWPLTMLMLTPLAPALSSATTAPGSMS